MLGFNGENTMARLFELPDRDMIVNEFENEDVVKPNYTRKEELC